MPRNQAVDGYNPRIAIAFAQGTRLGPYEILASAGAGGMGEVYRPRDVRLVRDVALKVLPALFANDAEQQPATRSINIVQNWFAEFQHRQTK